MGLPESYFWDNTPRKIIAVIEAKKNIEKVNQKNLGIYIASYVWGKDPDEYEDISEKPIAGIDVPINPDILNCMM